MKKLIWFLLSLVMSAAGIVCSTDHATTPHNNDGAVDQKMVAAPSLALCEVAIEPVEETPPEQTCFYKEVPLTYDEQESLQAACEEFKVPYALALGLIEKETDFRNILGDDGASAGYMQIQKKWHWDRMERLGVTDLTDPAGNFRVGLDFLSELYEKYDDWSMALTVYNRGHYPGYITNYAKAVVKNYEKWQKLVDSYNEERTETP